MEIQPQDSALIQVALLGTGSKQLDKTAFPQVLRPAIQQTLQNAQDSEDAFFQIAALSFSYALSTEQVKLNSFSIEEMARYQQLQSNLKPQALESTTEQSEDAAEPLLAKVQMHSGPLPLPFVNDNSPVFLPDALGTLINRVVANYRIDGYEKLLYWTLQKLEHCHMVLPPQCIFPLAECVFDKWCISDIPFAEVGYFGKKGDISYFMFVEQIFKVGGPGVRYVLQHFAPEDFESVFVQPEFVAHLDAHDGQVDYDYLLEHAYDSEVEGAFNSLRWQDPTRARELVQKYWKEYIFRYSIEFLDAMSSNLSLADEPFLTNIMQTELGNVRSSARMLLRRIVGSNYAKQCAQQFLAHVQYLGPGKKKADKGGLKIECFAYSDELEALGVTEPRSQKVTKKSSYKMLIELLLGMDLSDILALTGHANEPQVALDIWARHIANSPLFDCDINVCSLLWNKICLVQDVVAAEIFLQQKEWFNDLSSWGEGSLAQLFTPEKREHYPLYVEMLWGNFLSSENASREIDFNPLQDTWSKQLLDAMDFALSDFTMWPYSMIEGLKQYIAEKQQQQESDSIKLEGLKQSFAEKEQQEKEFYKLVNLKDMLDGLEIKQQIDELLKTVV